MIVTHTAARAGGNRCCGRNELSPLERRAIGVNREVHDARLAAGIVAVHAVLVPKTSDAMSQLVRDSGPALAERDVRASAAAAAAAICLVQNNQHKVIVRHPFVERVRDPRLGIGPIFHPAVRPRTAENHAECCIFRRVTGNSVVAGIRGRAHFVIDALADTGIV